MRSGSPRDFTEAVLVPFLKKASQNSCLGTIREDSPSMEKGTSSNLKISIRFNRHSGRAAPAEPTTP